MRNTVLSSKHTEELRNVAKPWAKSLSRKSMARLKRKKSGPADVGCKVMEGGKLQGTQLSAAAKFGDAGAGLVRPVGLSWAWAASLGEQRWTVSGEIILTCAAGPTSSRPRGGSVRSYLVWEFVAIFEDVARWSVLKGDTMEPCLAQVGFVRDAGLDGLGARILTIRLEA
ncbi:hypothetical protein FJTKL_08779 [Diaporthe vaccinii]|uniref:Uncharacterized protein n=1 Tax=Diaporthe vaccinii TaxID=105482 RepID=A0ABR4EQH4_9PEZI